MPVSHFVDSTRGILFIIRSGAIDTHDENRSFQEIDDDPLVVSGIPVIVDCTGVDPPDTAEIIHYIANHAMHLAQRLKHGPLAFVVNSDVQYGMVRMYELLMESIHADTEIFRSVQDAIDWLELQEIRS
jgi:hypothetical protein